MALPRIPSSGGVPRLAKQDPYDPVREAAAVSGIALQAGAAFDQMRAEMNADKKRQQEREAGLQMSRAMVRFEEQYGGRDSYSPDEIPNTIEVRRTEKVATEDGTVVEEPRQSIPAYEVFPELYRKFASNFAESAASGIDDETARSEFMANAESQINNQYVGRLRQSRQQQEQYITKQLTASINEAVSNGQFGVGLALAEDIQDPNVKQQTVQQIKVAQETSYYDSLALRAGDDPSSIPELENAIAELRDTEQPSNLTNAQRLAKAKTLETAVTRASAAAVEEEERAKQLAVSMTWLEIQDGNPTFDEAHVNQLFEDKIIGGSERTQMIMAIDKKRAQLNEESAAAIDLDRVAAAGYGIDPKDKQARKAVNSRFEGMVQQGQEVFDAAVTTMREYKVIPEPIISMFRSANRGDAPNLEEAAQLFIVAQEQAPQALADFKDNEVDFIEKVAANMQLGMDKTAAVDAVRSYDALSPTQKSALRQNAATMVTANADSLASMVSDQPSYDIPWSPFDPDVPLFMQAEFDSLVQKTLPTMGFDVEASRRKAFNTLTKTWRMTDINGDYELMKNAPVGPTKQVRRLISSQYRNEIKDFSGFYGRDFSAKDIKIKADSLTEIQIRSGQKPTYMAYVVTDEDTQQIEQLDRFTWDANAAAKQRREDILKEAQKSRTRVMEQQEKIERAEIGGPTL